MTAGQQIDSAELEAIAASRSHFYETATAIVSTLPDDVFLKSLETGGLDTFLTNCSSLNDTDINRGVGEIIAYIKGIDRNAASGTVSSLAIDRTRLFRFHGDSALNPPYEGQYLESSSAPVDGNVILKVKTFYRWAGIIPSEDCPESPDYLSVQLDFMRMLCLREKSEWKSSKDARATVSLEGRFISDHLGRWLGSYCEKAEKLAETGFYRGFVIILDGMIKQEMQYLSELQAELEID